MKYMGSKNRIAKNLLPIILKNREPGQWYVEPFVGGANMIDKVDGNRIGADFNEYLISMWISFENGEEIPKEITKELYNNIRANKKNYSKYLVGYVGIACSYKGKWFGGYAGKVKTKGGLRDYQIEAYNNISNQIPNIKGVDFRHSSYQDLDIPPNSIIYCDPPYEGTTKYKAGEEGFNHVKFWEWCRVKSGEGHTVFISEYTAPADFICVYQQELANSLNNTAKNTKAIERLFIPPAQKGQGYEPITLERLENTIFKYTEDL